MGCTPGRVLLLSFLSSHWALLRNRHESWSNFFWIHAAASRYKTARCSPTPLLCCSSSNPIDTQLNPRPKPTLLQKQYSLIVYQFPQPSLPVSQSLTTQITTHQHASRHLYPHQRSPLHDPHQMLPLQPSRQMSSSQHSTDGMRQKEKPNAVEEKEMSASHRPLYYLYTLGWEEWEGIGVMMLEEVWISEYQIWDGSGGWCFVYGVFVSFEPETGTCLDIRITKTGNVRQLSSTPPVLRAGYV